MFARAASLIVVALVSSAAVAAGQIASVTRISLRGTTGVFSQYLVDVTLDREICFAAAGSSASSLNMLWPQGLVQMRVDSGVVSIVIDPQPVVPSCLGSNNVTVLLPPLEPGDYSVRVAAAERRLTSSGNGNSLIGPSASLSLRQVADSPTGSAIPVYGIAEGAHTALTLQDLGARQFFPLNATDQSRWQAAFYAWSPSDQWTGWSGDLRGVYELVFKVSGSSEPRWFYTIDLAERNRLVAAGVATPRIGAAFLAVPPAGGACRDGTVAIYRAFDATRMAHRYAPLNTYLALQANG